MALKLFQSYKVKHRVNKLYNKWPFCMRDMNLCPNKQQEIESVYVNNEQQHALVSQAATFKMFLKAYH